MFLPVWYIVYTTVDGLNVGPTTLDEGYPVNYGVLVITQLAWKQYTIVLQLNHQGELVMNPIANKNKHSKTKST